MKVNCNLQEVSTKINIIILQIISAGDQILFPSLASYLTKQRVELNCNYFILLIISLITFFFFFDLLIVFYSIPRPIYFSFQVHTISTKKYHHHLIITFSPKNKEQILLNPKQKLMIDICELPENYIFS